MFCSHCGKSIRPEDASCPHCGAVLGEDRFLGNMYTSSQVRLPVDALDRAPAGSLSAYTRTDYMSYDNQPENDVYSNTTYRPLLNDDEDLNLREQEEARAAEEADDAPQEAGDEAAPQPGPDDGGFEPDGTGTQESEPAEDGEPADEFGPVDEMEQVAERYGDEPEDVEGAAEDEESVSPLPEIKPRGISPAVQRYMREAEERHQGQAQRSSLKARLSFRKKQPEPEYEEPAEDVPGAADAAETGAEAPYGADAADGQIADDGYEPETAYDADADEAYEGGEYEDGAEEDGSRAGFKLNLDALKNNRVLRIALAAALVLAVLIGGVHWLLYVTSNLGTKIAGVTHSTYAEGIRLINSYATDEYRSGLVQTGSVNAAYAQQQMDEDMAKLRALMPEDPQENDQIFVNTLTTLHEGIQSVINADAAAVYNGTQAEREAASQQEWAVVRSAVSQLNEATAVAQLNALAGDIQTAVIPQPTSVPVPTATPEPEPLTLREGIKDNDDVQRMQRRLIELGFLDKGADGDFGPKTTAAVKAFQKAAGLTEDGVATAELLDLLYSENAPTNTATEAQAPERPETRVVEV